MTKDREFYRTIFKIAIPSAFQSLITFLVVIVDNIMVGRLGGGENSFALAAVSQTNAITAFFTATLMGIVGGSAVLISQYWGKKDVARIKQVFSIVMMLCVGAAVVVFSAAKLFPETILSLVIKRTEAEVFPLALKYFSIVVFSYIPYALTHSLVGMLKSVEVVKVTLYISIVSLFTNIGFNYALIFGKFGFPAMGVEGAAVATIIARVVEMAIVWYYTFRVQKQISIAPRDLLRPNGTLARDYAKYGLPVAIVDMQWSFIGMLKAAIIGQLGASFMAAVNISDSMMQLGTMFTFALAGGACVVVGKTVGAGNTPKVKEYSKTIQIMFAVLGFVMAGLVILLRAPFISLYGAGTEEFALAKSMIFLGAISMIGTSYHAACFVGINRGAGDNAFVAKVDSICGWLVVLPCTLLAAFVLKLPLPFVYLSTRIDQCYKWIIAFIRLRGDKWIHNVTRDEKGVKA